VGRAPFSESWVAQGKRQCHPFKIGEPPSSPVVAYWDSLVGNDTPSLGCLGVQVGSEDLGPFGGPVYLGRFTQPTEGTGEHIRIRIRLDPQSIRIGDKGRPRARTPTVDD
jgi:hypothetical protein